MKMPLGRKCKGCGYVLKVAHTPLTTCRCGLRKWVSIAAGCLVIDDDEEEEWVYYTIWEGQATVRGNYLEF